MRFHRFYITDKIEQGKELSLSSPDLIHQVTNVFRLGVGDRIILFNGTGNNYECKIDSFEKGNKISSNSVMRLSVLESKPNNSSSSRRLFLVAAVTKKDTFEWIAEKSTELGVSDIIPVLAERSEKKSLNEERVRKIAIEASEQSGRDTTPLVWQIMGLGGAVEFLKREVPEIKMITFHTEGKVLKKSSLNMASDMPIAVFIGPEGGWSPAELEVFHKEGILIVCLGPQILRAETAAVAALSMVVFG